MVTGAGLDVDWERYLLEQDAAHVAALTIAGRAAEADAYVAACRYSERLAAWRAAR